MGKKSIIEIHRDGRWIPAATLTELGSGRCRFEYETDYIFSANPLPLSLNLPVQFNDLTYTQPDGGGLEQVDFKLPPFLFDLVPQGRGRALLNRELNLADQDGNELPLLFAGAFNPIGCLRLTSAVDFYNHFVSTQTGGKNWRTGVELTEILSRSENFLEQLSLHSLLASGTTGAQGAAPKFLLTQDKDGLWFPDMALPDDEARQHWLVKLPRGKSDDDRLVLRNEAAYMQVAKRCGLRVHAAPELHNEMLFVPRFDRWFDAHGNLHRLHQESLASLAHLSGFSPATSQNKLLTALRLHASAPLAETIEFLKRDALNQALRNTDNHARNAAVQRLYTGQVLLTPLYDFAPMYKDPEIIPRAVHWTNETGKRLEDWSEIMDSIAWTAGEQEVVIQELAAFAHVVAQLPETARDCGVEQLVLNDCARSIERVANSLSRLD